MAGERLTEEQLAKLERGFTAREAAVALWYLVAEIRERRASDSEARLRAFAERENIEAVIGLTYHRAEGEWFIEWYGDDGRTVHHASGPTVSACLDAAEAAERKEKGVDHGG